MTGRVALGAVGVGVAAYGAWLLLSRVDGLVEVAAWLVAGLVVHDFVVVPSALLLGWAAARWLPWAARGPAAVGAVVLGTLTIGAVPVLGRFGAVPDDPTLLDRDYTGGWLLLAGLVVAGFVAGTTVRARRGARRSNTRSV